MKKMKKYFGNTKKWTETLYHYAIDEYDLEWFQEEGRETKNLRPGDSIYYLLDPPFTDGSKSSIYYTVYLANDFEDTNIFITDTEIFNSFKKNRI